MIPTEMRILLGRHRDAILAFATAKLPTHIDPMEREMMSWTARWRGEALDHYLPQGWSFGAFAGEEILGVILAQPYLYHRGHAQTLWIEEILAPDEDIARQLLETAQKWARDKHFQCVLAEDRKDALVNLPAWPRARTLEVPLVELPVARY